MKTVAVALSVLTLAGSFASADARGFRLRGSGFSMPSPKMSTRRVAAVGAIGSTDPAQAAASATPRGVMTAQAQAADADENGPIPPMPPAPDAVPVAKDAKPWCPSGRIAGAGKGFCLIN